MDEVYLSIGTNLKDKVRNIYQGQILIEESIGKIVDMSFIYESEPWGFDSTDRFLNKVVKTKTTLSPIDILHKIRNIESEMGRRRNGNGYESRVIDIDILFYNDIIVNDDQLTIPHKHMAKRRFELLPLCQIAGYVVHPVTNITLNKMLEECEDLGEVSLFKAY